MALCMAACEGATQTKEENPVLESSSVSFSAVSSETHLPGGCVLRGCSDDTACIRWKARNLRRIQRLRQQRSEEDLGNHPLKTTHMRRVLLLWRCSDLPHPMIKKEESFVSALDAASYARQIVAVVADGVTAEVSMHEKDENGCWKEILSPRDCGYGRRGQASENTTATPKGTYTLTQAFGVSPDPGSGLPYVQVDESYYWVDDPSSPYYNQFVSTKQVAENWNSAEHLVDSPSAYAYAVAIDYNLDCVRERVPRSSFIAAREAPTAGCVSVPRNDMIFILQHLSEKRYIVIGTKEDFQSAFPIVYGEEWMYISKQQRLLPDGFGQKPFFAWNQKGIFRACLVFSSRPVYNKT